MRRSLILTTITAFFVVAMLPLAQSNEPAATETDTPEVTIRGAGGFESADSPQDLTVPLGDMGPEGRAEAWLPQPPGTIKWITLDYGPYVVHPGSDLSRMDVEIAGQSGYAIGFIPSVVYADGTEAPSHHIHIHHAHWYWLDPQQEGYHKWFYGTGEERTQGSIMPSAKADPRFKDGLRYGVKLTQGDRLGFLSMLHNKTAETQVVYLRVKIQYAYGTYDTIKQAKDLDFHELTPILIGSTFNVPRTGGTWVYPLDATEKNIGPHSNYRNPMDSVEVVPGVGQVLTMPWEGTVVIGAGHSHPGAREVVLSNMGSKSNPCPDDGNRFPGTDLAYSRNITRGGVFPSEEFQMGLTKPGWRVHVQEGDRLVINGVYDSTKYAYPDAMSYFGMYLDRSEKTSADERCTAELIDQPNASKGEITWTVPNQEWPEGDPLPTCTKCDEPRDPPAKGPSTNVVHVAGHQYYPGGAGLEGTPMGPPVVKQGDSMHFINEDYAEASVRHTVTSCRAPCNGPYVANYPFHDGVFDSGALGYMWQETYVNARDEPYWEFDTSELKPGYYTYYCRLHAWMRGSFFVEK